jgi:tryptophan synthase beta chain
MATHLFGLECQVYMVKVSYFQKPYRRILMELFNARVTPSPSNETNAGRSILQQDPESTGSLGIAISEAVEDAAMREDTKYSLGSVLNHVLMHQTVIGQEAKAQMEMAGYYPDVVIGCVGGGSNFGGLSLPFAGDKLTGKGNARILAVEPAASPSLTKGRYTYDFGDTAMMAPIVKMYTLGHGFVPKPIHAGGLRYHGASPIISQLVNSGDIEAVAYPQNPVFEAAVSFARSEGIVPAPESAHAIRAAIDEALRCKEAGEAKTILFNLSGHGHFDLSAYERYLSGDLEDYDHPADEIEAALANLPTVGS